MQVAIENNIDWEIVGSAIKLLTEVLELSHDDLLGRSSELELLVNPILADLGLENERAYPLAARLAILGRVILMSHLPDQSAYLAVTPLSKDELEVAGQLVSHVHRFDQVADIISRISDATGEISETIDGALSHDAWVDNGASIARAALLSLAKIKDGHDIAEVLQALRENMPLIDERIINAIGRSYPLICLKSKSTAYKTKASMLKDGMVLAEDLVLENGVTLLSSHHILNRTLIARLQSLARKGLLNDSVLVYLHEERN